MFSSFADAANLHTHYPEWITAKLNILVKHPSRLPLPFWPAEVKATTRRRREQLSRTQRWTIPWPLLESYSTRAREGGGVRQASPQVSNGLPWRWSGAVQEEGGERVCFPSCLKSRTGSWLRVICSSDTVPTRFVRSFFPSLIPSRTFCLFLFISFFSFFFLSFVVN